MVTLQPPYSRLKLSGTTEEWGMPLTRRPEGRLFFEFHEQKKEYSTADFDHGHHETGLFQTQNGQ